MFGGVRSALVIVWVVASASVGASSCAGNQSDRSRVDRAVQALDQKRYGDAVAALESEHVRRPSDKKVSLLLAQGYLGLGGFEILGFANAVMGKQSAETGSDLSVHPKCSSDAITKLQGYDVRCLLYRVANHLPNADDPNFVHGRKILEESFSDPKSNPSDVNFLMAFLELSAAVYRGRDVALKVNVPVLEHDPSRGEVSEEQFHLVIVNLKHFLEELQKALVHTRYSYKKIRKYVVEMDGKPLIRVEGKDLVFTENMGTPELVQFMIEVIGARADSINKDLSYDVRGALSGVSDPVLKFLANFDRTFFDRDNLYEMRVFWRFDRAISLLLKQLSVPSSDPGSQEQDVQVTQILWKHPPKIIAGLIDACRAAWDQETRVPILDYLARNRNQWVELGDILTQWDDWYSNALTWDERELIRIRLRDLGKQDKRIAGVPEHFTNADEMRAWQENATQAVLEEMSRILQDGPVDVSHIAVGSKIRGYALLQRTKYWIDDNLWAVH